MLCQQLNHLLQIYIKKMIKILTLSNSKQLNYSLNNCVKFNVGFVYKFKGIQKPKHAIHEKQYEPFINNAIGIIPTPKFKSIYSSLLRSLGAMYNQKLKQILHPLFPPMIAPPKTKFINDTTPITIYYGDCYYGSRTNDQNKITTFQLSPIKENKKMRKRNMHSFQLNDPNINVQNWKLLGMKQTMDHQAYFKISMEIFCLSKMKLISNANASANVNETKQNIKKQEQLQEVHQLRMQINGIIPREQIHQMDKLRLLGKSKESQQKQLSILKEFIKKYRQDWRLCEMDYCFGQPQSTTTTQKKWFGIF